MTIFNTRRSTAFVATLAGIALLSAACGSSSKATTSTTVASPSTTTAPSGSATTVPSGGSTATTVASGSVPSGTLNGSGSTFQAPYDADIITAFDTAHPGVTINYAGGGSGKGQSDLLSNLVDFAGSDSIPPDLTVYKGGLLFFPTVVAPITLSYNLPGVKKLVLTATVIAKIYNGTIKTWNAPAITADNPGVTLPGTAIVPAHRSDGSGTTSNFTKYLSKADPTDWTRGHGSTVNWPAGGQAGNGNPGVAKIVQSTTGAIGYVDYSDAIASNLQLASIKNSAGNAEAPTLAGASAAAKGATVAANLTYDPINSSDPNAYPITSPTYILAYATQSNPTKAAILKAFLSYILTTGQGEIAAKDDFAPLPAALAQQAIAQLSKL